ncbi:MAG: Rne/Rng family ribonuclease [Gemmatimonadota bacterium]|nr:MAG: Rne/Rng family ribonuclease [Gemmatimonadota bacterium]
MKRQILINAAPHETRVVIMEDNVLVELMLDRPDAQRTVGDIYLGRVEGVLPGIQAAFVNIGTDKAAFLHVSDIADEDPEASEEEKGVKRYPPIQTLIKKGEELLVQVTKEAIGTKGPRVTAQVSLPGRYLVYMPRSEHIGVSRKIEDRDERTRLRRLMRDIMPPGKGGTIVRTVGEDAKRKPLERELKGLMKTWKRIESRVAQSQAPALVHEEAHLAAGIIRDLFSEKVDALIVDSREIFNEVRDYLEAVDPELIRRVSYYDGTVPLFDKYEIEEEIRRSFERRVELPSGGYVVIEPTEGLVAIDVNTGRYTGKKDPEKTILRTNLDAAREIARQLRLRDIGGIIVVDFIDMEDKANRDKVMQELRIHLSRDRARTKAFQISELGLVEMTRQRVRPSIYHTVTRPCPYCVGAGRIVTPATVVRRVERAIGRVAAAKEERRLVVRLHPEVALHILEEEPNLLRRLESEYRVDIEVRDDPLMRADEFRILAGPADVDITARYAVA